MIRYLALLIVGLALAGEAFGEGQAPLSPADELVQYANAFDSQPLQQLQELSESQLMSTASLDLQGLQEFGHVAQDISNPQTQQGRAFLQSPLAKRAQTSQDKIAMEFARIQYLQNVIQKKKEEMEMQRRTVENAAKQVEIEQQLLEQNTKVLMHNKESIKEAQVKLTDMLDDYSKDLRGSFPAPVSSSMNPPPVETTFVSESTALPSRGPPLHAPSAVKVPTGAQLQAQNVNQAQLMQAVQLAMQLQAQNAQAQNAQAQTAQAQNAQAQNVAPQNVPEQDPMEGPQEAEVVYSGGASFLEEAASSTVKKAAPTFHGTPKKRLHGASSPSDLITASGGFEPAFLDDMPSQASNAAANDPSTSVSRDIPDHHYVEADTIGMESDSLSPQNNLIAAESVKQEMQRLKEQYQNKMQALKQKIILGNHGRSWTNMI